MGRGTAGHERGIGLGHKDKNFVCEPHSAICSDGGSKVLNMIDREAAKSRDATAEMSRLKPDAIVKELRLARADGFPLLEMPRRHAITIDDINPDRLKSTFAKTYEQQPQNFEALLGIPGVGAKTIRALSLVGQLLYGAEPSFRDPARFSFVHGGKDDTPYPVDRKTYDTTASIMEKAVSESKVGQSTKLQALRRMEQFLRYSAS